MPSPQHVTIGSETDSGQEVSLLEILDNVLNSGVVIQGSIVLSLAGVDLVYVGLNVVLTSVETALRSLRLEENAKLKQFPRK
jgi:gas vesicle structural protein